MKDKILKFLDFSIYWSIVIMPFSVAIAPGLANTFIGFFIVFFIIKKLLFRQPFSTDGLALIFFGLFFLVSLISIFNSISFATSLKGVSKLIKDILILLVCSEEIRDKKHLSMIIFAICFGVCLSSLDALWQMISGYDFIRHNAIQSAIGLPRPTAAFPNPNVFGIYMSALTPLIFGLTFFYFKGKNRLLMSLVSLLALCGVVLTLSRGSGLGVYLAMLFLSIINKKKMITLILIGVVIISPFLMPRNIKQWIKEINYNPVLFIYEPVRISIAMNVINMVKQHPFIGVGLNTFSKNYGKYKTEQAEKYFHTPDTIYAHNTYLQMAGEIGLLGLAAFLLFLFQIFRRVFDVWRRLKDEYLKVVGLSLAASLIAFLINGLTETSLYYSRVAMIFWFLLGMSLAFNRFANQGK